MNSPHPVRVYNDLCKRSYALSFQQVPFSQNWWSDVANCKASFALLYAPSPTKSPELPLKKIPGPFSLTPSSIGNAASLNIDGPPGHPYMASITIEFAVYLCDVDANSANRWSVTAVKTLSLESPNGMSKPGRCSQYQPWQDQRSCNPSRLEFSQLEHSSISDGLSRHVQHVC